MTFEEIMQRLESLGTAQNRKVYSKHGAPGPLFGVSFAEMRKLARKLRQNHPLALQLWNSGNGDARMLAAMIADPAQLPAEEAIAWIQMARWHCLIDELVGNVLSKGPVADTRWQEWINSPDEWLGRAGWGLVIHKAMGSGGADIDFAPLIPKIEQEIRTSPNRKREAMNSALIAIGIYRRDLTEAALAAGDRIGKVDVDHGDTACKTPEARPYIARALARQK